MQENEDVPPLEDMSELVDQIKDKKKLAQPVQPESALPNQKKNDTVTSTSQKNKTSEVGYGGFRKGFLFGNKTPSKVTKKSNANSSPKVDYEVKAKKGEDKSLVFDEVQEAVKENGGFLGSGEWVTSDLLKKIEGNDKLLRKLTDPKFSKAVELMQKDPKAAMELYKDQQDIQDFFLEFYKVLGSHFTAMGEKSNASSVADASAKAKSREEIEFEKTISQPEVRQILAKPSIQNLFAVLKANPEEGQRLFHSAEDDLKADVQKLVEAGLLSFQLPPKLRETK